MGGKIEGWWAPTRGLPLAPSEADRGGAERRVLRGSSTTIGSEEM